MRKHFAFLLSIIIVATCGFYVQASDIAPEEPLSAQWVPNAVKITFDSNGGGVAPATQVYTYGIERSLPNAGSMSKSGYHFIGWAETPTATSPTWYGGNISSEAFGYADETKAIAKTLYAVWEEDDTATAADVKKDLTAHINDTQVSGTMPTYNSISKYLNAGESYTLEPGYYAGGTIQGNTLASQTSANASASTIRSGYTAWVNGNKITGSYTPPSMPTIVTIFCEVTDSGSATAVRVCNGSITSYYVRSNASTTIDNKIDIYISGSWQVGAKTTDNSTVTFSRSGASSTTGRSATSTSGNSGFLIIYYTL